jgi:hypothetical protein
MGCWDVFCILCGNTCHSMLGSDDEEYIKIEKKINSKLKWLNRCTFLTLNDKVIHSCIETECNVSFRKNNKQYEHITKFSSGSLSDIIGASENMGVFVHDDCWKFVKQTTGVELKYSSFPIDRKNIKYHDKILNINYGKIEQFWSQDFMFDLAYKKGLDYLCESPLKNKQSATAIKKVLSILKIKKKDGRLSPSTSATFYKTGTIKIGIDGNFWKKYEGKWIKIQGTPKTSKIIVDFADKKAVKKLNDINQIGDMLSTTVAVKSFDYDHKKKLASVTILHL